MSGIRHIASDDREYDLFATAEFERAITVWSFRERTRIVEITSWLDFGGRRLAILPSGRQKIAVGAYNRHGVALYDVVSGTLVWQRRDLKRVQFVCNVMVDSKEQVGVGRESGPFLILDADTGETQNSLTGIKKAFSKPTDGIILGVGNAHIELVSTSDWSRQWKLKAESVSFAVLDAAFGKDSIAVSHMGGPLRFIDMHGELLAEYSSNEGSHVLRITWNSHMKLWVGIERKYSVGGSRKRLLIDDAGTVVDELSIEGYEHGFFQEGDYLITSDGEVRKTESNELVWRFA